MGFRLRQSIKLFRGVRINLSKSGVSASVGESGATLNFSSRGTRATVGLPGSGLSYREKLPEPGAGQPVALGQHRVRRTAWLAWIVFAAVILVAVLAVRAA